MILKLNRMSTVKIGVIIDSSDGNSTVIFIDKTVVLPSKQLLDYVLSHFGFQRATYSNGPSKDGRVKAVVQFIIPYMEHLKYCGTLNVKGKSDTSAKAEEAAAFEPLKLIEVNFKCKIIDLNHSDRVEAESIQSMWEELIFAIEKKCEEFADHEQEEGAELEEGKQNHAYQKCAQKSTKTCARFSGML